MARVTWTDLPLARATVDRAAERRSEPGLITRLRADPATRVVLMRSGLVATLTADDGAGLHLVDPAEAADLAPAAPEDRWLFLGADAERSYLALVLPDPGPEVEPPAEVPPAELRGVVPPLPETDPVEVARAERLAALTFAHMRRVGASMPARDAGLGVAAVALAAWHRTHRCCPRCGTPTVVGHAGWVRHCPTDGVDQYPRTDPAVIMAVVDDDDRLLLGHAAHWPEHRFSTLAGYVEPGEGLEQAVRREVAEEVGVTVGEVEYRGSQPWPFPASLMLAFRARALSAGVTVDAVEITEARWFTRAELVAAVDAGEVLLPMRSSIARALIEEWAGQQLTGE